MTFDELKKAIEHITDGVARVTQKPNPMDTDVQMIVTSTRLPRLPSNNYELLIPTGCPDAVLAYYCSFILAPEYEGIPEEWRMRARQYLVK